MNKTANQELLVAAIKDGTVIDHIPSSRIFDVVNLLGDPTKAMAKLGWNPKKTSFEELVKIMDKIAAEHEATPAQVALQWTAARDFVSTCLVGAQTRDKVEDNTKAFNWSLTEEEIRILDQAVEEIQL